MPLESLRPMAERTNRMFLRTTPYQVLRQRLACADIWESTHRIDTLLKRSNDYLVGLNNSRFCLCPRGVAGTSFLCWGGR